MKDGLELRRKYSKLTTAIKLKLTQHTRLQNLRARFLTVQYSITSCSAIFKKIVNCECECECESEVQITDSIRDEKHPHLGSKQSGFVRC
jgi:hypothetical protein